MTEAPLGEAAMLAALQDIHLPVDAPGGPIAEIAAAMALGGVAALAVAMILRLATRRPTMPVRETLSASLDRLATSREDDRRVALLRLLKERAPERFETLAPDLYRPHSPVTAERLEAELRRLA